MKHLSEKQLLRQELEWLKRTELESCQTELGKELVISHVIMTVRNAERGFSLSREAKDALREVKKKWNPVLKKVEETTIRVESEPLATGLCSTATEPRGGNETVGYRKERNHAFQKACRKKLWYSPVY